MHFKILVLFAPVLIWLGVVGYTADSARSAPQPLKLAWEQLVPDNEELDAREQLTSFGRYELQNKMVRQAQKDNEKAMFAIRLRVSGLVEPMLNRSVSSPNQPLALLHGQYVDQEHQDRFGKDATIGIWVRDFSSVKNLKIGDEFELQGKIIYVVYHVADDVDIVKHIWRQRDINTSVAYLQPHLTGFSRDVRIYMVNPKVVAVAKVQSSKDRESQNQK